MAFTPHLNALLDAVLKEFNSGAITWSQSVDEYYRLIQQYYVHRQKPKDE